ncbi:MAG: hypothetical protein M3Y13_14940 [Armatimonadota bacterium]|nr:hypothetical protein [Armatimonadota bacterium]
MIRRFLTRILMVTLIACCGYNWLQVQHLQAQVNDLSARLAAGSRPPRADSDWLVQTDSQVRSAQRSLRDLQVQMAKMRAQANALWRQANRETLHKKREILP